MFREDFVMRHIRLFVQVLAQLLGLIEAGDLLTSLELIETAFRDYLGLEIDNVLTIPEDRLIDYFSFGEQGDNKIDRCLFAVTLLLNTAQVYRLNGRPERALPYHKKSLALMLETLLTQRTQVEWPSFAPTLDDILDGLEFESLPLDSQAGLVIFSEQQGDFRRGADLLVRLINHRPDEPDVTELARSFYEMLMAESDENLIAGNLERPRLVKNYALLIRTNQDG